ncbi:probable trafficking protein particle complex subunit 13 homolog [Lutzomyia longipalpis]|uniref:probable trafficking protein particle complex subunit 13 homolog n=1 Tax=Lutzomyia longipalpis TaxID=7200 RepID=UPI002483A609|nr:probable trafficking protein particle complex subunit 13 homolog [Lutzomyia longipalpis]
MTTSEPSEHLLALKVMRLTRPTLVNPRIVTSEAKDLTQNCLSKLLQEDVTTARGMETIAGGSFMLLPQSFGNIYLGESFSSYICVHNCTKHPVHNVTVKADLQSTTSRINLPMHVGKELPATLNPEDTLDDVIHHEVVEIGTHILVCEVQYTTPAGLPSSFRKFFKFQVVKPLDVKTKFYNAETDEVYLEAQIQNITAGTICLEKVELESSDKYTVTELNTLPSGESVFPAMKMLQPLNSCQFLYCIKPIPAVANDPNALRIANDIGKLDIVWRSNLGERGRLQTSQLQRSPIDFKDLRLSVIEAESIVRIGAAFNFKCRITNTSDQSMDLALGLMAKARTGCTYTGSTEYTLGTIASGAFRDCSLTVFPVQLGLITITDLQLTDTFLKKTYKFEDFLQVFVVDTTYDLHSFNIDENVQYYD